MVETLQFVSLQQFQDALLEQRSNGKLGDGELAPTIYGALSAIITLSLAQNDNRFCLHAWLHTLPHPHAQ